MWEPSTPLNGPAGKMDRPQRELGASSDAPVSLVSKIEASLHDDCVSVLRPAEVVLGP